MIGAVDNLLTVVGPEWTAIIAEFVRESPDLSSISIHRIDVEVAVADRCEHELLAIKRDGSFCVVPRGGCKPLEIRAVRFSCENVEVGVNSPNVPVGKIGSRWTLFGTKMCR